LFCLLCQKNVNFISNYQIYFCCSMFSQYLWITIKSCKVFSSYWSLEYYETRSNYTIYCTWLIMSVRNRNFLQLYSWTIYVSWLHSVLNNSLMWTS
jgi:hypothetical protein